MALQSQQTQLKQLRHTHMLRSLFMHNVNRPQSSYEARSIVDIKQLATSMNKPLLPGIPYPPTFLDAFHSLPSTYQLALTRLTVFKFCTRKATPEEYRNGLKYTQDAEFFLKSLKAHTKFQQPHMLLGFRCQCCLNYRDGDYVRGSTSFVDMSIGPQGTSVNDALTMRIRHLVACPCVSDLEKSSFASCTELTDTQRKNLDMFVTLWTQTLLASHFPTTFPSRFLPGISQYAIPWYGGDMSHFSDAVASPDLFDAISFASQLLRDGSFTVDDMSETMQADCFPPSLFLDLLSELCVMRVTICHETHVPEATLHCSKCNHHGLSLPSLTSEGRLPKTLHTDVRDFVLSHVQSCGSIPISNKQVFKRVGGSVVNFWYSFCAWWQYYFAKRLRGFLMANLPKQSSSYEYFRYMTIADRKKEPYKSLPLLTLPNPVPPNSPTMNEDQRYHIFLHNDLYQDFVGNRWFRCQISKHRPLYLQMSDSVQQVMKKSILDFISKSGYSFVLVSSEGNCDSAPLDMVEKYVTDSLLNGFPQVAIPPTGTKGDSKVFDIDIPPMIGVLSENVRWDDQENSDFEITFPILKKDKAQTAHLEWGDVWPSSPEELVKAIRMVNGDHDKNDQTTDIVHPVSTGDNAVSTANTTPDLVSQPDSKTPAVGTHRPTTLGEINVNDLRLKYPVVSTSTQPDLQCNKRNQPAISPNHMDEAIHPNTSKRTRTS